MTRYSAPSPRARAGHPRRIDLGSHPLVGEVRGEGLIGAVELVADKATGRPFEPLGRAGAYLFQRAHEHGLIIRAIGDTIAFCPPLIATEQDIRDIGARFERALADTGAWLAAG